jgi:L-lactate utilization protein LutB
MRNDKENQNMTVREKYNALLAAQIMNEFSNRGIDSYYCETREIAVQKAVELLPKGCTVSCGGSETLQEIGLRDELKDIECEFWDPLSGEGSVGMDSIARRAMESDYYFMGSNAVTMEGELVNADGYGNRIAALIYGPKHVIVITGMNKVVKDVTAGIERINNVAAPMICLKFKPDSETFADAIDMARVSASHMVITSQSVTKNRITVILVGESLGY